MKLAVPACRKLKRPAVGRVRRGIRPQHIHIDTQDGVDTMVSLVEPMGRDDIAVSSIGDAGINFLVDPITRLKSGDRIKLKLDMDKSQFFDTETELSLLWA